MTDEPTPQTHIIIEGARVHNLKEVSVAIPHNALTVVTGLSGSGKSSLVFDVIYAEGQRRYMETLNAYARQFLGNMERPDVDYIDGLAPVIAIEQRTTGRNSRSTVGTITEIYDYLRLLYARVATAYSPVTGEALTSHTIQEIDELIRTAYAGRTIALCAPVVRGRKGHYQKLFADLMHRGYLYVRVDGKVIEMTNDMKLDRYAVHDIELIIDRLEVPTLPTERFSNSLTETLRRGRGLLLVVDLEDNSSRYYSRQLMCPTSGYTLPDPEPHTFSFNSQYGACPVCHGIGVMAGVPSRAYFEQRKTKKLSGVIDELYKGHKNTEAYAAIQMWVAAWLSGHGLPTTAALKDLSPELQDAFFYSSQPEPFDRKLLKKDSPLYNYLLDTWRSEAGTALDGKVMTRAQFEEIEDDKLLGTHSGILEYIDKLNVWMGEGELKDEFEESFDATICYACGGTRLNEEARCFRIGGKNIAEVCDFSLTHFAEWIDSLNDFLDGTRRAVATEILKEIRSRIYFLVEVGLGYLSLNRPSNTLSGGESQRIRLATQIGTNLVNVLYILDEPSIGLHPRDNTKLIDSLKKLQAQENTIIVVEHDEEMMRAADYLIDLGPGAGRHGGQIIAAGTPTEVAQQTGVTADYLSGRKKIDIPTIRRTGNGNCLRLKGAKGNNLKNINVDFPLGTLTCITGVSGSGKSTLINGTLYPILNQAIYRSPKQPLPYEAIEGLDFIDKVIQVDQSPLSKNPRSNPATFTGIFTDIRALFAATQDAKVRGFEARRFSFNVAGGRCETCKGSGYELIEMNFLPDVQVKCSTCGGERYNRETLAVRYKGKNISQVLDMTVNQAYEFFESFPSLARKLQAIREVGMGYIKLGQMCATLSGGENQRVRLATELAKRDTGKTLYIFDEPTTGLHFADVQQLLVVLNTLVDRGNTVIVIEHNLDVIRSADYLIDIGPESGVEGGTVIATGTPETVAAGAGHTAEALRGVLSPNEHVG